MPHIWTELFLIFGSSKKPSDITFILVTHFWLHFPGQQWWEGDSIYTWEAHCPTRTVSPSSHWIGSSWLGYLGSVLIFHQRPHNLIGFMRALCVYTGHWTLPPRQEKNVAGTRWQVVKAVRAKDIPNPTGWKADCLLASYRKDANCACWKLDWQGVRASESQGIRTIFIRAFSR